MMQTDTTSTQFLNALTELQFYAEESKKYQEGKEQEQTKKSAFSKTSQYEEKDPIPRAETVKKEQKEDSGEKEKSGEENAAKDTAEEKENSSQNHDSSQDHEQDNTERPGDAAESKHSFLPSLSRIKSSVPGKHTGMARYTEYDPAAPAASAQAVEVAIQAMKELQILKRNHYPYLLVCIRDDGSRTQTKFRTLEEAREQMRQEMQLYIDQIEPIDINRVVYVDDGCGAHDYEPTPAEELNPDGTFRHPSEINGTLHRLEEETKGIVYFETQNATSRWDILNTDEAEIGDKPDDPEFEAFIREAVQAAQEKEKEPEEEKKWGRHARNKRR